MIMTPRFSPILLLSSLMAPAILSACSDDAASLPAAHSGAYADNTLSVHFLSEEMPAKNAVLTLTDSTSSSPKGVLTLYSAIDLSSLGLQGMLPGPGVIPGSPKLSIPVTLTPDGDRYTFSGSGSTDFCSYSYTGTLSSDGISFNVTDATLKNLAIAGKALAPAPLTHGTLPTTFTSTPFHLQWDVDPIPGLDIDLTGALTDLVTAPLIPVYQATAYTSLSQMLESGLKSLAFLPSGNVVVRYMNSSQGSMQLFTAPGVALQYVVTKEATPSSPGSLLLYPNPLSWAGIWLTNHPTGPTDDPFFPHKAHSSADSRAISISHSDINYTRAQGDSVSSDALKQQIATILKGTLLQMMPKLAPMLATGIPMEYSFSTDGTVAVYIDTEQSVQLLTLFLQGLSQADPQIKSLLAQMQADPALATLLPQIQALLQAAPTILDRTTRCEIGLRLTPLCQAAQADASLFRQWSR